jgi:deoxyribonuclease-4
MVMRSSKNRRTFRLGVHTSITGGISKSIERAVSLGCSTIQIFSHNPRQWHKSRIPKHEIELFKALRKKHDISPVFIHASYLINLASLSKDVLQKSIELLSYEMMNADILGVEYVILHTGSASGQNEDKARKRAVRALLKAVGKNRHRASLLLENTAGQRGDITSSVRALAHIIDMCGCDSIGGICIDTCHAFSSGYDFSTQEAVEQFIAEVRKYTGINMLKLIHVNDSKKPLGSGIDRHEHIGKGYIGTKGFRNLLSDKRIAKVPMVLETPKQSEDDDKRNLRKIRNILLKKSLP